MILGSLAGSKSTLTPSFASRFAATAASRAASLCSFCSSRVGTSVGAGVSVGSSNSLTYLEMAVYLRWRVEGGSKGEAQGGGTGEWWA